MASQKVLPDNANQNVEPTFKGSELIRAAVGSTKDVLSVVLCPEDYYTLAAAEEMTAKFLKHSKEVK